jgi:hypothetical protein
VPVAVARAEGAERVIVVDATEHPRDSFDAYSPLIVADRLVQFLFHQTPDSLRPGDLFVRPDVDGFTNLNFSRHNIERLLARGVAAADTVLPRLDCRAAPANRPGPVLPTRLIRVTIDSANASERLALTRPWRSAPATANARLRPAVRRCARWPWRRRRTSRCAPGGRRLSRLDLVLRRSARRVARLGLAYDNELGGRMPGSDRRVLGRASRRRGGLLGEPAAGWPRARRNYQVGRQLFNPR